MENNRVDKDILKGTFQKIESLMPSVSGPYREKAGKISNLLQGRYDTEFCWQVCVIIHASYKIMQNRSREMLESKISIFFNNSLTDEEVSSVLNIVVFDLENLAEETDIISRQIQASMGLGEVSAKGEEVENAKGRFGLDATNPIPLNGIDRINDYFRRLRFINGERVVFERSGSVGAENLPFPVDKYIIGTQDNPESDILFVYAYHGNLANKAPEGFRLLS
jgi:hypothetical protein